MKPIATRTAPEGAANHFKVTLGEEEIQCRKPNFATRQELLTLYFVAQPLEISNGGGPEVVRALAATLGACWWHASLEIEADLFAHRKDLMRYGDLVLTELEDEGYDAAQIIEAASSCLGEMLGDMPTEDEVTEQEVFTEAAEVS